MIIIHRPFFKVGRWESDEPCPPQEEQDTDFQAACGHGPGPWGHGFWSILGIAWHYSKLPKVHVGVDDRMLQEWQCQYFVTVEDPPYSCRVHLRVVKTWHHAATQLLVRRKQLGNYQKNHQNWLKGYEHSKTWPKTLKLNPLTSLPYGKRCNPWPPNPIHKL